jgi:hypothetical protein
LKAVAEIMVSKYDEIHKVTPINAHTFPSPRLQLGDEELANARNAKNA